MEGTGRVSTVCAHVRKQKQTQPEEAGRGQEPAQRGEA